MKKRQRWVRVPGAFRVTTGHFNGAHFLCQKCSYVGHVRWRQCPECRNVWYRQPQPRKKRESITLDQKIERAAAARIAAYHEYTKACLRWDRASKREQDLLAQKKRQATRAIQLQD